MTNRLTSEDRRAFYRAAVLGLRALDGRDGTAPSINGRLPVPAPLPSQRLVMPDAWLANAHKVAETP